MKTSRKVVGEPPIVTVLIFVGEERGAADGPAPSAELLDCCANVNAWRERKDREDLKKLEGAMVIRSSRSQSQPGEK